MVVIEDIFKAKANRCLDLLQTSLMALEALEQSQKIKLNEYYRLRNRVREAKTILEEVMTEAHRLFGPPPVHAAREFEELRQQGLERTKLLLTSTGQEEIIKELLEDELIARYFSPEEVKQFVEKHFENQRKGKRKLQNLKARLLINKMKQQLEKADNIIKTLKKKVGYA